MVFVLVGTFRLFFGKNILNKRMFCHKLPFFLILIRKKMIKLLKIRQNCHNCLQNKPKKKKKKKKQPNCVCGEFSPFGKKNSPRFYRLFKQGSQDIKGF
jgi:hypothetical protein